MKNKTDLFVDTLIIICAFVLITVLLLASKLRAEERKPVKFEKQVNFELLPHFGKEGLSASVICIEGHEFLVTMFSRFVKGKAIIQLNTVQIMKENENVFDQTKMIISTPKTCKK